MFSYLSSGSLFFSDTGNREIRAADPSKWEPKKYQYAQLSSNPTVRVHIEKYHLALFLQLAKERNWKIQLKGLVSEARSLAASEVTKPEQDEFDEATFHRYLSNFIIADDQVCPYLMLATMLTFYLPVSQRCGMSRV